MTTKVGVQKLDLLVSMSRCLLMQRNQWSMERSAILMRREISAAVDEVTGMLRFFTELDSEIRAGFQTMARYELERLAGLLELKSQYVE